MPAFSLRVPHNLGRESAQAKLTSFVDRLKEKYAEQAGDATGNWVGNQLRFSVSSFGIKITGQATVEDDHVQIDGDIPFTALMFKGKIVESLKHSVERALAYRKPDAKE